MYGAGALGSLLGAMLASKNDVILLGRPVHVAAIRAKGLRVEGLRKFTVPLGASEKLEGSESPDLLLLTTKAYDTEAALRDAQAVVGPTTMIVTAQNGLGNYEAAKAAFPNNPVLAAVVTYGATFTGPGIVTFAGQGEILVGGLPKDLAAASKVARLLREAGFQALGLPDIRGHVWQKAIVNAAINPLSALLGQTNGELLEEAPVRERMRRVTEEAAAVARAQRIPLPEKDVFAVVLRVAEATAANRSSMLQSFERKRRTEIDAITGVFVEGGKRLGIPTPENEALLRAVKEREAEYLSA